MKPACTARAKHEQRPPVGGQLGGPVAREQHDGVAGHDEQRPQRDGGTAVAAAAVRRRHDAQLPDVLRWVVAQHPARGQVDAGLRVLRLELAPGGAEAVQLRQRQRHRLDAGARGTEAAVAEHAAATRADDGVGGAEADVAAAGTVHRVEPAGAVGVRRLVVQSLRADRPLQDGVPRAGDAVHERAKPVAAQVELPVAAQLARDQRGHAGAGSRAGSAGAGCSRGSWTGSSGRGSNSTSRRSVPIPPTATSSRWATILRRPPPPVEGPRPRRSCSCCSRCTLGG
jgi:hypothetical protein